MTKTKVKSTPQTPEEALVLLEAQLRRNEQEHESLIEKQKELRAERDIRDFNQLQAVLQDRGMTMRDLINLYS